MYVLLSLVISNINVSECCLSKTKLGNVVLDFAVCPLDLNSFYLKLCLSRTKIPGPLEFKIARVCCICFFFFFFFFNRLFGIEGAEYLEWCTDFCFAYMRFRLSLYCF